MALTVDQFDVLLGEFILRLIHHKELFLRRHLFLQMPLSHIVSLIDHDKETADQSIDPVQRPKSPERGGQTHHKHDKERNQSHPKRSDGICLIVMILHHLLGEEEVKKDINSQMNKQITKVGAFRDLAMGRTVDQKTDAICHMLGRIAHHDTQDRFLERHFIAKEDCQQHCHEQDSVEQGIDKQRGQCRQISVSRDRNKASQLWEKLHPDRLNDQKYETGQKTAPASTLSDSQRQYIDQDCQKQFHRKNKLM